MLKIIIILLITFIFLFNPVLNEGFTDKICGAPKLNRVNIWEATKKKYGLKIASTIFPVSYSLPQELDSLLMDENQHFILKKTDGFARNGLMLCDSKTCLKENFKDYNQAQVYIQNPLLINGFKFDIRVFMVSICGSGTYLYKNAYNVYTKEPFNLNSMRNENKINQSFTDDEHYDINNLPRRTDDLSFPMDKVWEKLAEKIRMILRAVGDLCCLEDDGKVKTYGLDVELLDNLDPMIIEMNFRSPVLRFDDKWKQEIIDQMKEDVNNGDFRNWIKIN